MTALHDLIIITISKCRKFVISSLNIDDSICFDMQQDSALYTNSLPGMCTTQGPVLLITSVITVYHNVVQGIH